MERVIRIEIKFTNATLAVVIGLLLLGAVGGLLWTTGIAVASPQGDSDDQPQDVTGIAALVGAEINYQGRLEGASGPVTMTFRLWEDETSTAAGDLLWEETKTVSPTGGLFNTKLGDTTALPADDIEGQELWLGVAVGDDEEMTPRQEILPVPYALSLRPGAHIMGEVPGQTALHVQNTSETGGRAIYGITDSENGLGGYFGNTKGGTALYAGGDVEQTLPGNGLVKAAVFAYCDNNDPETGIVRYFNNVNNVEITLTPGGYEGRCTINFGFDVRDRYIVATADDTHGTLWLDQGVTVRNSELAPGDEVDFFRYDARSGDGRAGHIAILVY